MGTTIGSYRTTLYAGVIAGDGEFGIASLFDAHPVSAQGGY